MYKRFEDLPLFMSAKQYAQCTGENVNTVRLKLREGIIPGDKQGGTWVICRDAVFPNASREVIGDGN